MRLAELSTGSSVFVDANIFIYAFSADAARGVACRQFLERIEDGALTGYSSSAVLGEVAHRLMTIEACDTFGWQIAGIAQKLRRHRAMLKQLVKFHEAVDAIMGSKIRVFAIDGKDVLRATETSQQFGVLNNDALVVAIMLAHGLANLASGDADFDHVLGLHRYGPVD